MKVHSIGVGYCPGDVVGWPAQYLLDHSAFVDPELDDGPDPILCEISEIIRAESKRVLAH